MIEKLLDQRIETIETIAQRLDALPAANGEPSASYWRAVRDAAHKLVAVAESKVGEHDLTDLQRARLDRLADRIGALEDDRINALLDRLNDESVDELLNDLNNGADLDELLARLNDGDDE